MPLTPKRRARGNLVTNGDFEDDLTDWIKARDPENGTAEIVTESALEGRKSLKLTSNGTTPAVHVIQYQHEDVAGHERRLRITAKARPSAGVIPRLQTFLYNGTNYGPTSTDGTAGEEQTLTHEFTVPATEGWRVDLRFGNDVLTDADTLVWDEVKVEDVTSVPGSVGAIRGIPGGGGAPLKATLSDLGIELTDSYTFEAYMKPQGAHGNSQNEYLVSFSGTAAIMGLSSSNSPATLMTYYYSDATSSSTGTSLLSDDVWVRLVGVVDRDAGEIRLYRDGEEIGSAAIDTSKTPRNTTEFLVGGWTTAYGRISGCNVALVRAYKGALTAAQISGLTNGRIPEGADCRAWYDFNDPTWHKETVTDRSGRNVTLTKRDRFLRTPGPEGFAAPDRLGLDLTFEDWPHDRDLSNEWVGRVYVPTPSTGASVRVEKDPDTGKSVLVCRSGTDGTKRSACVGEDGSDRRLIPALLSGVEVKLRARLATTDVSEGDASWKRATVHARFAGVPAVGASHGSSTGAAEFTSSHWPPTGTSAMSDYEQSLTTTAKRQVWNALRVGNYLCEGTSRWEYVKVVPAPRTPKRTQSVKR